MMTNDRLEYLNRLKLSIDEAEETLSFLESLTRKKTGLFLKEEGEDRYLDKVPKSVSDAMIVAGIIQSKDTISRLKNEYKCDKNS